MNRKKKLAIGTLIVGVIAVINLKVALDFIQSYDSKLASIEAITASDDRTGYESKSKDCSISTTIDGNGYITIAGKKFKVGEGGGNVEYTKSWSDAAITCFYGGQEVSCTTTTCADFYSTLTDNQL